MNINTYHNAVLEALNDTTGANNINEFREKFVAALEAFYNTAGGGYDDTDARNAIKTKTEVAALTSGSDAAAIVAALQA